VIGKGHVPGFLEQKNTNRPPGGKRSLGRFESDGEGGACGECAKRNEIRIHEVILPSSEKMSGRDAGKKAR